MRLFLTKIFLIPSSLNISIILKWITAAAMRILATCLYRETSTKFSIQGQLSSATPSSRQSLRTEKILWSRIKEKCKRKFSRISKKTIKVLAKKKITYPNRLLGLQESNLLLLEMKKRNLQKTRTIKQWNRKMNK